MQDDQTRKLLELGRSAKIKQYHTLLNKIASGKVLTATEQQVYIVLEDAIRDQLDQESSTKQQSQSDLVVLQTMQICALFGVDKSTLTRWKPLGADEAFLGRNQWSAKKLFTWWLDNIYQAGIENEPTLQAERLRYERARADRMEIEVAQKKELLISKEEVSKGWAWRLSEIVSGLDQYRDRLPPVLEGKSKAEMRQVIEKENWHLRDNYCREGKFYPKPDEKPVRKVKRKPKTVKKPRKKVKKAS